VKAVHRNSPENWKAVEVLTLRLSSHFLDAILKPMFIDELKIKLDLFKQQAAEADDEMIVALGKKTVAMEQAARAEARLKELERAPIEAPFV
jgi:hypothetical protein